MLFLLSETFLFCRFTDGSEISCLITSTRRSLSEETNDMLPQIRCLTSSFFLWASDHVGSQCNWYTSFDSQPALCYILHCVGPDHIWEEMCWCGLHHTKAVCYRWGGAVPQLHMSLKISHCLLIAHYTLTLAVFFCSAPIIEADMRLLF